MSSATLASVAVFGAVGALAGLTPLLDVLQAAAPLWLAAGLLAATVAVFAFQSWRYPLIAAGLGAAVASGAEMAAPLAAPPLTPALPASRAPRLSVVAINLWRLNAEPDQTIAAIVKLQPDVILASEPNYRAWKLYKRLRALYPYHADCFREQGCSAGVLSRWPVLSGGAWWPKADNPEGRRSGAAFAVIQGPDGAPLTVVATHVTWPFPPSYQAQERRELASFLHRFALTDAVVGGDFNTAPWSDAMREQDRLFAPLQRRTRALFSYPARFSWAVGPLLGVPLPFPLLPIDHVYAGPHWRTVSIARGPRTGSDHYPVLVVLQRLP